MKVSKAFLECQLQLVYIGDTKEEAFLDAKQFIADHPNGVDVIFCEPSDENAQARIRFPAVLIEVEEHDLKPCKEWLERKD